MPDGPAVRTRICAGLQPLFKTSDHIVRGSSDPDPILQFYTSTDPTHPNPNANPNRHREPTRARKPFGRRSAARLLGNRPHAALC